MPCSANLSYLTKWLQRKQDPILFMYGGPLKNIHNASCSMVGSAGCSVACFWIIATFESCSALLPLVVALQEVAPNAGVAAGGADH